jgi:hypothetical protein
MCVCFGFKYRFSGWFYSYLGKEEERLSSYHDHGMIAHHHDHIMLLLAAACDDAANTHSHRQKRGSHIRQKRGAHVGLVGGVGALPVHEVGDKEEGGRVVGVEESGGQALASRD